MIEIMEMPIHRGNVPLRVARGHFATTHSHINYYIDITLQKTRLSEAKAIADSLVDLFRHSVPVDTILCMDGTTVIGTCLARALTDSGYHSMNAHGSIYIVEPEYNANNQMIFRDNVQPMIRDKNVLVLMASVTTGFTAKRCVEALSYYGGKVAGVAALYSAVEEANGIKVHSVYSVKDLPDYESYDYRECPFCKQGRRLDALVNSFGYSSL